MDSASWFDRMTERLVEWLPGNLPRVVTAVLLVLVGFLIANLAQRLAAALLARWSTHLVKVLERVSRSRGVEAPVEGQGAEAAALQLTSRGVFWLVFAL